MSPGLGYVSPECRKSQRFDSTTLEVRICRVQHPRWFADTAIVRGSARGLRREIMRDPDSTNPDDKLRIARLQRTEAPQTASEVADSGEPEISPAGGIAGVQSTQDAQKIEQIAATSDINQANPLAALTEAIATGAINTEDARERLIDQIVRSQLPADTPPTTLERIRSEVAEMLHLDPTLKLLLER